jgi:MarR family 2-MHQ and catechol resistance regulon transcriptional repressor
MATHHRGTTQERIALDLYIKLSRAADTVSARINHHLHDHGLTVSQFGVLEALYHLGAMSPGQLCEKILRSTGNMTLVIDNLEKRSLVKREQNPDDRRSVIVALTPAGHSLITAIFPAHVAMVVETVQILEESEQVELARLCRKLGLSQTM